MKTKKFTSFIFHPILISIYPILALLSVNLDQIQAAAALRAVMLSLALGALLYGALRLLMHDNSKAALLSSFCLVLFFSYGHIYQLIEGKAVFGIVFGKHRVLAVIWAALLLLGLWTILKKLGSAQNLNQIFNFVSVFLLVFPIYQISIFEIRYQNASENQTKAQTVANVGSVNDSSPDIYYILLDGYSRSDIIQKLYNLDTTPFINELKSMGFVFPDCAQSNYGMTAFSMSATLNMDYLESLSANIPIGSTLRKIDYPAMREYILHSKVRQYLSQRGYSMVAFETGTWWLDINDADSYIVENNNPLKKYSQSYSTSNFEDIFLRTTALRIITEAKTSLFKPVTAHVMTAAERRYLWVKFELDELDKVPEIPGKKFVYFHVMAPHNPYIFSADGKFEPSSTDIPGYPNAVTYLNNRMLEIIRTLIAKSKTPPIIIIQGDHGWDSRYRMQILNGYYLPGNSSQKIYPTMTPVNTFRLVFNEYFGGNFKLLEDKSFYSRGYNFPEGETETMPYKLTQVPIQCIGEIK